MVYRVGSNVFMRRLGTVLGPPKPMSDDGQIYQTMSESKFEVCTITESELLPTFYLKSLYSLEMLLDGQPVPVHEVADAILLSAYLLNEHDIKPQH